MKRRGYHHGDRWHPVYSDAEDADMRAIDISETEACARHEIATCGHLTMSGTSFTWAAVYVCLGWEGGFASCYDRNKTRYEGWC